MAYSEGRGALFGTESGVSVGAMEKESWRRKDREPGNYLPVWPDFADVSKISLLL